MIHAAARQESRTPEFIVRSAYGIPPTDLRLSGMTADQIRVEAYALVFSQGKELCSCGNITPGPYCEECGARVKPETGKCVNLYDDCWARVQEDWNYCRACGYETAGAIRKADRWYDLPEREAYDELFRLSRRLGLDKISREPYTYGRRLDRLDEDIYVGSPAAKIPGLDDFEELSAAEEAALLAETQ